MPLNDESRVPLRGEVCREQYRGPRSAAKTVVETLLEQSFQVPPILKRCIVPKHANADGKNKLKPLRFLQLPRVSNFSFVNAADLRNLHSSHCRSVSVQRGEFHLVGETVTINVHDCSHVAGFQSLGGEVAC
jgi:hypothetical protein